ncbi:MAG: 2-vinyl bacteriochlorophyllide hydratase [Granulosicoccus sp.]
MKHSSSLTENVPLYTAAQRERRNSSRWTLVQGILAPVQFLVFLVSAALLIRYLVSGLGFEIAAASVVIKTLFLYAIMYTGALWEHDVYGQYLFAPAFYWEDMVSMVVIALHTAYLALYLTGWGSTALLVSVAIAAYVTYVVNAAQFVLKLRQARLTAETN